MALVDVTEILTDADLCDVFTVQQTAILVDAHGRTQTTSALSTLYGSVQPASEQTYNLFPDLTHAAGSIEVYSMSILWAGSPTKEADKIIFNGQTYLVQGVQAFNNFGGGFFVALCSLYDIQGAEPNTITSGSR